MADRTILEASDVWGIGLGSSRGSNKAWMVRCKVESLDLLLGVELRCFGVAWCSCC